MALPSSGPLSMSQINTEFGRGNNLNSYRGTTYYTSGGGPFTFSSGAISFSDFYGTQVNSPRATASFTFSSSTANASLNLSSISGYVAGSTDITVTINGGVYLYATTTGDYGLALTGSTAGDTVTIVNNGFIMGRGGSGVNGGPTVSNVTGNPGGPALNLNIGVNPTINNTNGSAYIGGGGGSGGGTYIVSYNLTTSSGGAGGAGGGNSGAAYSQIAGGTAAGAAGGGIGSNGSNGNLLAGQSGAINSGGGGGRVFPSSTTTLASNGTNLVGLGGSGGGTGSYTNNIPAGSFSNGGGPNQAGSTTGSVNANCGAGGGWGASGGTVAPGGGGFAGGAGGKAVNLNGRSVTWVSGDTSRVYGAIS